MRAVSSDKGVADHRSSCNGEVEVYRKTSVPTLLMYEEARSVQNGQAFSR